MRIICSYSYLHAVVRLRQFVLLNAVIAVGQRLCSFTKEMRVPQWFEETYRPLFLRAFFQLNHQETEIPFYYFPCLF
jgi:hypothetical protein